MMKKIMAGAATAASLGFVLPALAQTDVDANLDAASSVSSVSDIETTGTTDTDASSSATVPTELPATGGGGMAR